jgi:hypothetical protein
MMKTRTFAALAGALGLFLIAADGVWAQEPEPPYARLRVPISGTVTGKSKGRERDNERDNAKGTFSGTLSIERFAVRGDGVVAIGMVAGRVFDRSGAPIGSAVIGQMELPVSVGAGPSALTAAPVSSAAVQPQATTCGVLHLDVGAVNLNLLGLQVATQPVTIDLSAVSGGTDVLGHLICTALSTLNNVVGLVDVLNNLLGLVGGLLGGLTGGLTGGIVP